LAITTLPTAGWVTKVTVTGNTLHSRSNVIRMTDSTAGNQCNGNYNWIRINATAGNQWQNFQLKWDLWDASRSFADTWMFYGDSITSNISLVKQTSYDNSFAQQINAWNSSYYPSVEDGGMGGWTAQAYLADATTVDGSGDDSPWLPDTPAHFVALSLGTNDCNSGMQANYYKNMTGLVDAAMTDPAKPSDPYVANRVVIIPTLPASPVLRSGTNTVLMWNSSSSSFKSTRVSGNGQGPYCNGIIQQVISAEQAKWGANRVLAGPDLWVATSDPSVHWNDNIHPYSDAKGNGVLRAAWVQWAEANIFGASSPAPVNTGAPSVTGTAQQGQTSTAAAGSWSNGPTSYAFQWQDCAASQCANITGATNPTYTAQASDVGDALDVVVTARNPGGSASATSAETQTVAAASGASSGLSRISVSGTHYVTGSGQTVELRGVLRNGPEYACQQGFGMTDGPTGDAEFAPMASWKINSVFLGLDEQCWLGVNGVKPQYAGQNYINFVKSEVVSAEKYGIYPVIGFFTGDPAADTPNWYDGSNGQPPLADNDHTPLFWEEVAKTFKGGSESDLPLGRGAA
jgi:hypothetical protein